MRLQTALAHSNYSMYVCSRQLCASLIYLASSSQQMRPVTSETSTRSSNTRLSAKFWGQKERFTDGHAMYVADRLLSLQFTETFPFLRFPATLQRNITEFVPDSTNLLRSSNFRDCE